MRSILLVVCVLATACVGQLGNTQPADDDDDPPVGAARDLYIDNVDPIMARCQGVACHSIDATASAAIGKYYVTGDPAATYTSLTQAISIVGQYNEIAPILTKIDAGHQGITYSTADREAIIDWLSAEAIERADDNNPPPVDPIALLKTFSSCMTIELFNQAQMAEVWSGLAAGNGQACLNCHQAGAFGFTVSNDANIYHQLISTSMSQHLKYFSVAGGKVVINMGAFTNAAQGIPAHPPFDPVNNAGMPALQAFYTSVDAATIQAGPNGCGPAKLIDP